MRFAIFNIVTACMIGLITAAFISQIFMASLTNVEGGVKASLSPKPAEPLADLRKATTPMSAETALAAAMKAIAGPKYSRFSRSNITIYPPKDDLNWVVRFVALPETIDMFIFVNISNDGSATILQGL